MPRRPLKLGIVAGGGEVAPRLTHALELVALGCGLTLTVALLARLPSWLHDIRSFQLLFAMAFAFYALALLRLRRYARLPHVGMAVLAVSLATRVALLPVVPSLSGEIFRSIWEGRVVARGGNPYRQPPADPSLIALRDRDVYPGVDRKLLGSLAPPFALAGAALVARVSDSVTAFKLWVILHDILLVAVLVAWLRRRGESPAYAIAYAWNPLVLVEYAGSGHGDPTAMVWLALAFLLADSRPLASALALALGSLTRLAPLAALPFLLRLWPWRARLACLVPLAAGLAWTGAQARGALAALAADPGALRNNELLFHYLDRAAGGFGTACALGAAAVVVTAAFAWRRSLAAPRATQLAMRAGLVVAPALQPWYLGWPLLFEHRSRSAPWIALSLTAALCYGVLATPGAGREFHLPLVWRWVEYGVPLGLAAWMAARGRSRARRAAEGPS